LESIVPLTTVAPSVDADNPLEGGRVERKLIQTKELHTDLGARDRRPKMPSHAQDDEMSDREMNTRYIISFASKKDNFIVLYYSSTYFITKQGHYIGICVVDQRKFMQHHTESINRETVSSH
jgi:hypothetical protein